MTIQDAIRLAVQEKAAVMPGDPIIAQYNAVADAVARVCTGGDDATDDAEDLSDCADILTRAADIFAESVRPR